MEQVVLHARLINPHSLVIYDRFESMSAKSTQGNDKKAIETGEAKNVSGHFSRVTVNETPLYPVGRCAWSAFFGRHKKAAWIAAFYENRMAARASGQSLSE